MVLVVEVEVVEERNTLVHETERVNDVLPRKCW